MAIVALILGCVLSFLLGFLIAKEPEEKDGQEVPEDNVKLRRQWEEFLNYKGGQ